MVSCSISIRSHHFAPIRKWVLIVFSICLFNYGTAQITITVHSLPKNTPENATLYLAGNFNDWSPNSLDYSFKKSSTGNYFIDLPTANKSYEYKITLGSWNSSEMNAAGGDIQNRKLFARRDSSFSISIESWKSIEVDVQKQSNKSVQVFSENFPMQQLNKSRRIWIYLPTDYSTRLNKRYPVLYMHDGQNLFDNSTAYNGEWEVDETLQALQNKGDSGIIVVGIDNGGGERIDEFSPWKNSEYGGGKGKDYLDFVAFSLKPVIDMLYRTKPEPEQTAMMGSSMAGLITLYAAFRYDKIFSKFGVFSPALWFSDSIYQLPRLSGSQNNSKIYLLSGILESSTQAQETYSMRDSLLANGFSKERLRCELKNDGTHSEWFWKREFADCYSWLFDPNFSVKPSPTKSAEMEPGFNFRLDTVKNKLTVQTQGLQGYSIVVIRNKKGTIVAKKHLAGQVDINLSRLSRGEYTLTVNNGKFTNSKTFEKK